MLSLAQLSPSLLRWGPTKRVHFDLSRCTLGYLEFSRAISDKNGISQAISSYLGLSSGRHISSYIRLSWAILEYLELSQALSGYNELSQPYLAISSYLCFFSGNCWPSLSVYGFLWLSQVLGPEVINSI